ncbi:MAG: class I SAM-dependent methyltransferase [Actinobacteria bacterium]|jgi:SAM-dependent methyltransferase|nr:class I SAM-dependent methyltransferase [Actinomycetota bacterium]
MDEHALINLANWESRVPIHAASRDYGLDRYLADPRHLSGFVAHDAPHLGDLTGLRVVHPQCHIGTDTLSLARLGGEVTGVDFSPSALEVARDLAERAGPPVRYVEAAVDDIPEALPETFDLVYTGVGALNWLPSVARWARIMAGLLAPGGRLFLREGHPILGALDEERDDDLLVVTYPYFETPQPNEWVTEVSYTDGDGRIASPVTREWAHGLAETVQAVLDAGLTLTRLEEHTELEWQFLDWMVQTSDGRWALPDGRERLPLMFSLEAVKPG